MVISITTVPGGWPVYYTHLMPDGIRKRRKREMFIV
jgi:hypothetical protein